MKPLITYLDDTSPETLPTLPFIGKYKKTNYKVLFTRQHNTDQYYGIVVESGYSSFPVGYTAQTWCLEGFIIERRPCTVTFEVAGK